MKSKIRQLVATALEHMVTAGLLDATTKPIFTVERTRDPSHGDFASNLALILAKPLHLKPRAAAKIIVDAIPSSPIVSHIDVAGPGFINFHIDNTAFLELLSEILTEDANYGRSNQGAGTSIQVEFVSANPTGPLHVGHGRGAAYGSVVANLLETIGFKVHREYYINDAGRQMDILAVSVWIRYLELCGETLKFPSNGYHGDYVWDIAANLHRKHGNDYRHANTEIYFDLPLDAPDGDKEQFIDAMIAKAKKLLGPTNYRKIFNLGLDIILADIRDDLGHFGVHYDTWYYESGLVTSGAIDKCIEQLKQSGYVYENAGALWFKSSAFGDEKDRVVVRENGQSTYFASDIAYHLDKLNRGFDKIIDIWGADHHGYIPRMKAALQALGHDPSKLEVRLVQFVVLYLGKVRVSMSTRSGEFETLRVLRKEVTSEAARFFYVMRTCEQQFDFDLELAKSKSADNPIYYIQYAHARIRSVFRQAAEKGIAVEQGPCPLATLKLLNTAQEQAILRTLSRYPEVVESAALQYEPHQLTYYLQALANEFHVYYNSHTFLVEDAHLRTARLNIIRAVAVVLRNGLNLIGISAPESM
ncbi:arginine--tRNA ligase [Achromatium sp. WMS2]|nr:arginine--tRNA ligase [Achromatium sp. WMS2]